MPYKNPIAITIDNNYVQHACVMLLSLNANVTERVNVYCIYSDLSDASKNRITKELKNTRVTISFVEFNTTALPQLPVKPNDHVSPTAYLRIWLPLLFAELEQILFLDTDIVVNADISYLLNLVVKDKPLAAIPDTGMSAQKKGGLGMPPDAPYFNSGVMVINLDYFRKHQLTEEISQFIEQNPGLCEFWDQDALNAVIKGNFELIDYRYNAQSVFFDDIKHNEVIIKAAKDPAIIHFTGGGYCKPWFYHNQHPLKHLYYHYLKQTSFKGYLPPDLPRSWRIFRKIKFRLFYR